MKIRGIITLITDTALTMLFVFLLIFPEYASDGTREALSFCATTLVPSLFIYMVLAKIVITLPMTDRIAKRIGVAPVALITGMLCGAPIGAKNALALYESSRIDKKYAEYLCSFTNNASISFVIGFVGAELFDDTALGVRLFLYQLAASLVTAAVMKYVIYGREKLPRTEILNCKKVGLRDAVTDSALTMLNICACAVFFIVAGNAVSAALRLTPIVNAVFKSVLEFSSGCAAASKIGALALPVTAFSIGFNGLSVALQVRGVIAGRLAMKPFLTGKLISCAVMTLLAVIFG